MLMRAIQDLYPILVIAIMVRISQDIIIDLQNMKTGTTSHLERMRQDILTSPIMLLIVVEILIRQIYLSLIIIGQYYQ